MTIPETNQIIATVATLLSIANIAWTWQTTSRLPTDTALKDLDCAVEEQDRRIQAIESDMRHLPTKDEITALRLQIADVIGELKTSKVEVSGINRTLRRIEDHLRGANA